MRKSFQKGRTMIDETPASEAVKLQQYQRLVKERKACRLCDDLTNPAVVRATDSDALGHLDSDEIGPYSQWHHDLNATLLVVAKDFASVCKFKHYGGWPGTDVQTNNRLSSYLSLAGFRAGSIKDGHSDSGLFFTNAVLCLPGGPGMRTTVKPADVRTCAAQFLKRIIAQIAPRAIATLGSHATKAVVEAEGLPLLLGSDEMIQNESGIQLPSGPRLFPMWHPVASKTTPEQEAAWKRLGGWLKSGG
jgi:Uracil DNA glycosylase superfamily